MKKRRLAAVTTFALITVGACASQPYVETETYGLPGFWGGLLNGFVAWFAVIGHIFNPDIRIYAFPNAGGWYDFGFMLGTFFWVVAIVIMLVAISD